MGQAKNFSAIPHNSESNVTITQVVIKHFTSGINTYNFYYLKIQKAYKRQEWLQILNKILNTLSFKSNFTNIHEQTIFYQNSNCKNQTC